MSFGSDSPGGSPDGIGGNESGIGSSSNGGEGNSYSAEAMANALEASDAQMRENNMESGLAMDPNRDAQQVGDMMSAFASHPEAAEAMAEQNRQNDFKNQSLAEMNRSRQAANAVGMDKGYMGTALGELAAEKTLNYAGGTIGGALGGALGSVAGPVAGLAGSTLGNKLGGKFGTSAMGLNDQNEMEAALGLADRVTGSSAKDTMSQGDVNWLVQNLIKNSNRRG